MFWTFYNNTFLGISRTDWVDTLMVSSPSDLTTPEKVPEKHGRIQKALSEMASPQNQPRHTASPGTPHHQNQTLPLLSQSRDSTQLQGKENNYDLKIFTAILLHVCRITMYQFTNFQRKKCGTM